MSQEPRTAFVGLSHLGIVSSAGWSSLGQPTVAIHPDAGLVERLRRLDIPVLEPGLMQLLEGSGSTLMFSTDLSEVTNCPLVIFSLDVATDEHNVSNIVPLLELIDGTIPHLQDGATIALNSQVHVGFCRALVDRIRQARPALDFELFYWVETLVFGRAVERFLRPERLIVGCADPSFPLPSHLGNVLTRFGCPIIQMGYESAELTKMAINLYLIGSVTYANTLSELCEAAGADWSEIVPALRLDRRIGPAAYLQPSLGIAGGNLERDLVALRGLLRDHELEPAFLDALATANRHRLAWVTRKIDELVFSRTPTPTIGIWGLAYKANTRSTRNSPAIRLIRALRDRARVQAWDPVVTRDDLGEDVGFADGRDWAIDGADCLVIMTDWPEFNSAEVEGFRSRMRHPLVIDCVGALEARRADLTGVDYVSMGR